jgi:hypothetical protein
MRPLLTLALSLILLPACFSGSGGGGQHACLPVAPLGSIQPPSDAGLADYVAQLDAASHQRWPSEPQPEDIVGLDLVDRQLFTYRRFYPDVEDLDIKRGDPAIAFSMYPGLGDEHAGAAAQFAQWAGYELVRTDFDSERGITTYYMGKRFDPPYSRRQSLWLANWTLEQFPSCILFASLWYYERHEQGAGGSI